MDGLNKITDRILNEAKAEADGILKDAEKTAREIRAKYDARVNEIRDELTAKMQKEGTDFVTRAKSSVATQKRNVILQRQSDLIDEVFEETRQSTCALTGDASIELLTGLLCAAVLEQVEAENLSRTLYGEEDALNPEHYDVVMNSRDRDKVGQAVVDAAKKKLAAKLTKEQISRVRLSEETANIDGGLILKFGNIESNCSYSLLFAQLREALSGDVSHVFFDPKEHN